MNAGAARTPEFTTFDRSTPWHATAVDDVLQATSSSRDGLSGRDAAARLRQVGPNRLPEGRRQSDLQRFFLQFHNVLIYVLLGAAGITLLLGHVTDSLVILAVVLINALVGFVQEGRAERALDAIRGMVVSTASVLRDGRRIDLAAEDLVPGDIVLIEAGDQVPADLRLLRARNLTVDEAALTGESVASDKAEREVAGGAALGDRYSMVYSGTIVATGQGTGVVVATGATTELGRIGELLGSVDRLKTPLIRQMDRFARQLTIVILGVSVLVFLFALLVRDYALADAFMVVVGLAVSAIPEGLPAIMTITLAIGVQRMAARNAIVRRLPAVETLGSVSVICSDKTGTLTRNEMSAQAIVTSSNECDLSDATAAGLAFSTDLIRAGLLCNNAEIRREDGVPHAYGDPMEAALVTLAIDAGFDPAAERRKSPRIDEIPFDSQHRFMATLTRDDNVGAVILLKGAPERILSMCASERIDGHDRPVDPPAWHARADRLAARGYRVLAFASRAALPDQTGLNIADVDSGAVMLGLVGFIDPLRQEAMAAVRECRDAGIRVLMITGDHAITAREIARQLGLADDPHVMTGKDLDSLEYGALADVVRDVTVFARTTPEHKLRLVEALQAEGRTVAMTGDGVNDAPALKRADVGVAMGKKGTEATREAAEIVLTDDNFASIVAAVREGRTVYDNVMKVIAWTMPTSVGEAMTIMAAISLGLALPITPVQILWVNLITAVTLGLALSFEPTEPGTMHRSPRRPDRPVLGRELLWQIVFVSVLFMAGAFGMFYWAQSRGLDIEGGRTLVVNTLVAMEVFYLFNVRFVHGASLTWRGIVGTPAVLIGIGVVLLCQLAFTYAPLMQRVFGTQPVHLFDGAVVIGVGLVLFAVVELEKSVRRRLIAV